jgi:hypothetical protein
MSWDLYGAWKPHELSVTERKIMDKKLIFDISKIEQPTSYISMTEFYLSFSVKFPQYGDS